MPARDWAWGPSANWKIYPLAKRSLVSTKCSFVRKFFKIAEGCQNDFSRLYRSLSVQASKIVRPHYHSFHNSGGNFGPLVNAILTKSKKKQEAKNRCKRRFMKDQFQQMLTTEEVDKILRKQEHTTFFDSSLIGGIDFNELASNRPMEDQTFAYRSNYDSTVLVGLLDGHGGSTFGEYIKKYLPLYVSVSLLDTKFASGIDESLSAEDLIESLTNSAPPYIDSFLQHYLIEYAKGIVEENPVQTDPGTFSTYVRQLLGPSMLISSEEALKTKEKSEAIKEAFVRLDLDMTNELIAKAKDGAIGLKDAGLMSSGCCALVALIRGPELHVANSGDCRAVMGSVHDGAWSAIQLTLDHTANSNPDEVQRILNEHPREESRTCFQYGRLFGRLAPLRAFGDIRFKMEANQQQLLIGSIDPKFKAFAHLKTPPYLTAEPEVFQYKLEKNDKFIVLATDGLWDMLSNQEVVELVRSYMEGRAPDAMMDRAVSATVTDLDDVLAVKSSSSIEKDNVATFLIRCALGGYDHTNLSSMLTLPYPEVRMYRDDISVSVVFFDHDESRE